MDRVPAAEIEAVVVDQLRVTLRSPEIIGGTLRAARPQIFGLSERQVREALEGLNPLLVELFPTRQTRVVERIDVKIGPAVRHRGDIAPVKALARGCGCKLLETGV